LNEKPVFVDVFVALVALARIAAQAMLTTALRRKGA
jgi:hypothetical protein